MLEEYKKARKLGQKQYKKAIGMDQYPYPAVLDELLGDKKVLKEVSLGLQEIPLNLIIGTRTAGRKNVFSPGFLPLLDEESEFAIKWMNLYNSQMDEGFRDPIKAYEYKNRFYVEEGNKRVSVAKYLQMPMIMANVTRIMPTADDSKESKVYAEFLKFYKITKLNQILFSEPGSYDKLLKCVGKSWDDEWEEDEIKKLTSVYYYFCKHYEDKGAELSPEHTGDAFLRFLLLNPYEEIKEKSGHEIADEMKGMKSELVPESITSGVEHVMDPEKPKTSLVKQIIPVKQMVPGNKKYKAAFIYDTNIKESDWIYAHELGRIYVQEQLREDVETSYYEKTSEIMDAGMLIDQAIEDGNEIIFTTTPNMMQQTVKKALKNPDIYFFNCSLNFPYKSVRTYYTRTYEVKFLTGLIAGAMADSDVIEYEADYPIYGSAANVNAFALGVQMVNPKAKVRLHWQCLKEDLRKQEDEQKAHIKEKLVSAKELITSSGDTTKYGLYQQYENGITKYATAIIDWGKFYEHILTLIINGTWKKLSNKNTRTLNYWWGLSADVIDLICSEKLPHGTRKLVERFKSFIAWGFFHPFEGVIYDQNGKAHGSANEILPVEEIVTMNWLCENVIGSIPTKDQLNEKALQLVELQGVLETE